MITVLTILLFVCCILTACLLFFPSFKNEGRFEGLPTETSETESSFTEYASEMTQASVSGMSPEERETRELIGNEEYERMSANVSELLKRHADDSFSTVMLTGGTIERHAEKILHSLLPGDTLRLQNDTRHGIPEVGVYFENEKIGRLLLDDANDTLDILNHKFITGTYVAEQNSFGASGDISVKLIIFYSPATVIQNAEKEQLKTPYKVVYNTVRPIVIYQN